MKPRTLDPLRLDVEAFAIAAGSAQGAWPGAELPRWAETQTPPQDGGLDDVAWDVRGERKPVIGGEPEIWLSLSARGHAWLTCQRCLQPFALPMAVDQRLRFVRGESQAAALDAEIEDDVLAITRALDLRELVEDELLLAMPIVPRHEACPQPLPMVVEAGDDGGAEAADGEGAPAERPNPFAVLQALKTPKGPAKAS